MSESTNHEIVAFIDRLADVGSNYRISEMEPLYTDDLGFLVLTPDGGVQRFSKSQMLDEFQSRRDAGEAPLSTEKRILHIEENGVEATAILYRRMSSIADPALYELRLRKIEGAWKVSGETVAPWPDLASSHGFLPPRSK